MNLKKSKEISILFLYKKGRKKRLLNNHDFPSEFFYGYNELKKDGYNVKLLEELDFFNQNKNIFLIKLLNISSRVLFDLPIKMILGFLLNKSYKKLNKFNIIIATTNSLGITLSFLKAIGLVNSRIIYIYMGLFTQKPNLLRLYIFKYIFKKVELLTLSNVEYNFLRSLFINSRVSYLPFGVDANFWFPQEISTKDKPYILAIGNDLSRDWDLLTKSWEENFPTLKIVSSLPISNLKKNIEIIKGNWHSVSLSDLEMRDLYRNSEFIVIPLKETLQPSGQSTCLQAMSCSKAVVLTKIKGIWDQKLMKHKENIFFIEIANEDDLKKSIKTLLKDNYLRDLLGKSGRDYIVNQFNTVNMANTFKNYLFGKVD